MNEPVDRMMVDLRVWLPGRMNPVFTRVALSEDLAQAFRPLPRDREIIPSSEAIANAMSSQRRILARELTKALVHQFLDFVEKGDPIHGYSPEQWEKLKA